MSVGQTPEHERGAFLDPRDLYGFPHYDAEAVAGVIVQHLGLRQRVLDLGCGDGRTTRSVARLCMGARIVGVDISPTLIEMAKVDRTNNVSFVQIDGRNLPDDLGRFDGAYSITVFQHLPHDVVASYIHQVSTLLDPAGVFVFTVSLGDEEAILSHQCSLDDVALWCWDAGLDIEQVMTDMTGWTWVATRKAEPK